MDKSVGSLGTRGEPENDRLLKLECEEDGTNSGGGRKADGGDGSTRSFTCENLPRVVEGEREDEAEEGPANVGDRIVTWVCQEGRRSTPTVLEEPSVYDLTDLMSSSATSDPSSVKTSLLLSDELYAASCSRASVEEVASCNPIPN